LKLAANQSYPRAVPPLDPAKDRDAWANVGASLLDTIRTQTIPPAVGFYARLAKAYAQDDAAEFNAAIVGYKNWLAKDFAKEANKGALGILFQPDQTVSPRDDHLHLRVCAGRRCIADLWHVAHRFGIVPPCSVLSDRTGLCGSHLRA
jgi:hypothetical protein